MKPKTYKFKGQEVIAVPETHACEGCIFDHGAKPDYACDPEVQDKAGVPTCGVNRIIFKPAP